MRAALVFLLLHLCFSNRIYAQEKNYKAYSLYVYNFMKYIEWPEEQNKGDFIIAIIGKSPIEKELTNLAKQKKIKGRTIILKSIQTVDEIQNCHLLYLAEGKSSLIKEINTKLKSEEFLVVAEKEGLANKGAALSFATLEDDALSFDINKKVITERKLKISTSLIKLGTVVVE